MEPKIYKPSIYNGAGIYKLGGSGGDISILDGSFTPFPIYRKNSNGTDYVVKSYIQDYYTTNSFIELSFVKDNDLFSVHGTNVTKLFSTNQFYGSASEPLGVAISAYNKNIPDYDSIYNFFRVMNYSSGALDVHYNMGDFLNAREIKIEIDSDKVRIFFDNQLYSSGTISTWGEVLANAKNFYTFGSSGTYQSLSTQIGFSRAKITNKTTNKLQFDFISCRRELDQKLGVWDNVSSTFYQVTTQSSVDIIT